MNIHLLLQLLGTLFLGWNLYESWQMMEEHRGDRYRYRYAASRLSLWSVCAGLALGYWIEVVL